MNWLILVVSALEKEKRLASQIKGPVAVLNQVTMIVPFMDGVETSA